MFKLNFGGLGGWGGATERRDTSEVLFSLLEEGRVVIQSDVRLTVVQPVVPAESGSNEETQEVSLQQQLPSSQQQQEGQKTLRDDAT